MSSALARNGTRHPHSEELLVGQRCRQQGVRTRSQEEAGRHADLGPGAVEAAPVLGSVLDGHQRRTTPLAADAKALSEAQHDEQNRCPDADRGVAGQQAHQHRRRAHEQQRVDQHWLAADLVAVVGEDHAAEGPGDKPDGERRESGQRAGHRIKGWEEDLVEDQGRGGAEDEEVVPLDRRADEAGEGHLARERNNGASLDRGEVSR